MKQKRKIIGALCLLVLFVTYQVSIAAFIHVHNVDGVLITHSHPFHNTHSHSKTSLSVIGQLPTLCSPETDAYKDLHPMCALLAVFKAAPPTPTVKGEVIRAVSLRAPPTIAFHSV